MNWQPISTAPRDGTFILSYIPKSRVKPAKLTKKFTGIVISVCWVANPKFHPNQLVSDKTRDILAKQGGFWSTKAKGKKPLEHPPSYWMPLPIMPEAAQ